MKRSLLIYTCFLMIACIGMFYGNALSPQFSNLRIWTWENLLYMFIGLPFLFLLPYAKLNYLYDEQTSWKHQIGFPLLIGIFFGVLDLLIIEFILPHPAHTSLPPYTQPFPYALFLYFSGAFEIEVFYRLIPVTLVLATFASIKGGKHYEKAFWTIACLTALREPLEQFPSGAPWFIVYALFSGFIMNFIQVIFLKKYSFTASLALRLGHYLIWHILNGIYIQYFLL